ncbi:MAG TPA: HAD-IIIA family hydrolase [Taishania sp.]|nr:HAD-IIIA family hydrolase [Taishania sp.]
MITYKEKLNQITTFIFDIDGVLTNGDVYITNTEIIRVLNSKDGYAIQLASKLGYNVFIITGGSSNSVKEQLLALGVHEVCLSSSNKMNVYTELKVKYNLSDEEILYMGDDIPDMQVMQAVGCATCPQDAAPEIKEISHYQSPFYGGKGAVRDIISQTLKVHRKWLTKESFIW